jgi:hypothetical protein
MKLKDKKLLITDLCARLPYGVYVEHTQSGFMGRLHDIDVLQTYNKDDTVKDYLCYTNFFGDESCKIEYFKPYLFPLSSATKKQKDFLKNNANTLGVSGLVDWFNEHHFDHRGLIDKGLALDATNKNIY